ncbi:MAG: M1 family aminopeptidase, partial [Caulobacterales bacterium]
NGNLAGLYRVEQGGLWYAMTQFEPVDARRAFPSFDEPAFKTPFKVSITAPAGLTVVSNGLETKKERTAEGWERHEFAETPPLPTYLIAMAVGPYDVVEGAAIPANGVRRAALPLRGIATKGKGPQLAYALNHIAPVVNALEGYFGTPYPFSKLDVMAAPDFESGAMENAGLITFREPLLLLSDTSGVSRKRDFLLVMSHELSHQWFGNLVTPQWWDDIWLNEAFASWMEAKIANQVDPSGDYLRGTQRAALRAMRIDGLSDVRRVREPVLRTEDIEDAFDFITYEKGAAVLAMFERYLGEAAFREGVRRHMERFARDSATADDFFQSLAQGAQRPEVVPAFKSFVDRPGVPIVGGEADCTDPLSGPQIIMRQARYAPLGSKITVGEPWIIPACVAGMSDRGRQETCVLLDRLEQNTPVPTCPKAVIPNVGGVGYYRLALNSENAEALLGMRGAMSPGEILSLTESLDAAYRSGTLDGATYLKGMRSAAASPLWDVAAFPAGYYTRYGAKGALETMVESVAPDARADFATIIRAMYAPRLQSAPVVQDDSTALLRKAAVQAVAIQGRDPALRQSLIESVLPVLGFPAPESGAAPLDEDLREAALIAAIQDRGKPVLDAVFIVLKNAADQSFRRDAIEALGEVQDRILIDQVLRSALSDTLSGAESYDLISVLMSNPAAQDLTWVWLKKNYSAFAQRTPEFRKAEAPSLMRRMCSTDAAADVDRFFQKNATNFKPSRRVVAMTVEEIQLCASLRRARSADLKSALAAAAAEINGASSSATVPPVIGQTTKPKPAAKPIADAQPTATENSATP